MRMHSATARIDVERPHCHSHIHLLIIILLVPSRPELICNGYVVSVLATDIAQPAHIKGQRRCHCVGTDLLYL